MPLVIWGAGVCVVSLPENSDFNGLPSVLPLTILTEVDDVVNLTFFFIISFFTLLFSFRDYQISISWFSFPFFLAYIIYHISFLVAFQAARVWRPVMKITIALLVYCSQYVCLLARCLFYLQWSLCKDILLVKGVVGWDPLAILFFFFFCVHVHICFRLWLFLSLLIFTNLYLFIYLFIHLFFLFCKLISFYPQHLLLKC